MDPRISWRFESPWTAMGNIGVWILFGFVIVITTMNFYRTHNLALREISKNPANITYLGWSDYSILADKTLQYLDTKIFLKDAEKAVLKEVEDKTTVDFSGTFAEISMTDEGGYFQSWVFSFAHFLSVKTGMSLFTRMVNDVSPMNTTGESVNNFTIVNKDELVHSDIVFGRYAPWNFSKADRQALSQQFQLPHATESYAFMVQYGVNLFHTLYKHQGFLPPDGYTPPVWQDASGHIVYDVSADVDLSLSNLYGYLFATLAIAKNNPHEAEGFVTWMMVEEFGLLNRDPLYAQHQTAFRMLLQQIRTKQIDFASLTFSGINDLAADILRSVAPSLRDRLGTTTTTIVNGKEKILSRKTYTAFTYRSSTPASLVEADQRHQTTLTLATLPAQKKKRRGEVENTVPNFPNMIDTYADIAREQIRKGSMDMPKFGGAKGQGWAFQMSELSDEEY